MVHREWHCTAVARIITIADMWRHQVLMYVFIKLLQQFITLRKTTIVNDSCEMYTSKRILHPIHL